jgi:hypothetical protein
MCTTTTTTDDDNDDSMKDKNKQVQEITLKQWAL